MKNHGLMVHQDNFLPIISGKKTFIYVEDRNYMEGDIITLREWNIDTDSYTGNELVCEIGWIESTHDDKMVCISLILDKENVYYVHDCFEGVRTAVAEKEKAIAEVRKYRTFVLTAEQAEIWEASLGAAGVPGVRSVVFEDPLTELPIPYSLPTVEADGNGNPQKKRKKKKK